MTLTDIEQLQQTAEKLDGRPLPGVRMTEKQFDAWLDEDIRAEWIDGEVIVMSPASRPHVLLNFWLVQVVGPFVEAHDLGEVQGIEMQVRLPGLRRRRNPDLLFVSKSRQRILKDTFVDGAPDLVMEIVSPDSTARDWRDKYLDYAAAGVREYWIIDLADKRVEAYRLDRTRRYRRTEEADDRLPSTVLKGFYLRPMWLFQSPLPRIAAVLKELGVR